MCRAACGLSLVAASRGSFGAACGLSLVAASRGSSLVLCGLPIVVASLVARACALGHVGLSSCGTRA